MTPPVYAVRKSDVDDREFFIKVGASVAGKIPARDSAG